MESPDVYQLTRIRWQLFGSLTFTSERMPEKVRLSMWFAHCRKTTASFRVYFPNLLWCLRQEEGEQTGRRHFHYLLGGIPEKACTVSTCFAQMATWEGLGGGMARVRLFDPSLNGVDYVAECLQMTGADKYESAKFGSKSSSLILSKGAEAKLRRIIREERRVIQRQEKRAKGASSLVSAGGGGFESSQGLDHRLCPSGDCRSGRCMSCKGEISLGAVKSEGEAGSVGSSGDLSHCRSLGESAWSGSARGVS